jgi:hypothetical protein
MTQPKVYEIADALALLTLMESKPTELDIRNVLIEVTDIPEASLDKAVGELEQGLEPLKFVLEAHKAALGRLPNVQELAASFETASWVDDDLKQVKYGVKFESPDGEGLAEIKGTFKLN